MIYWYVSDKVSSNSQSLRVNISNKKFLLEIVLIILGCIVLLFLERHFFYRKPFEMEPVLFLLVITALSIVTGNVVSKTTQYLLTFFVTLYFLTWQRAKNRSMQSFSFFTYCVAMYIFVQQNQMHVVSLFKFLFFTLG